MTKAAPTKKAPVRTLRESFFYSAVFKSLATNVAKTYRLPILGDSGFEWAATTGCYIASLSSPTANNALFLPDIAITIRDIGNDRFLFNNDELNALDIVGPAGLPIKNATPIFLRPMTVLEVTVTSAYTNTLPFFGIFLSGTRIFKKVPPPPVQPTMVKMVS